MRTLQIRETVTILKVDFPVDARIRPFMSPTRKRDPASLSSNRRRPLDTPTSPRDQTSEFLMRCKTMLKPCHVDGPEQAYLPVPEEHTGHRIASTDARIRARVSIK